MIKIKEEINHLHGFIAKDYQDPGQLLLLITLCAEAAQSDARYNFHDLDLSPVLNDLQERREAHLMTLNTDSNWQSLIRYYDGLSHQLSQISHFASKASRTLDSIYRSTPHDDYVKKILKAAISEGADVKKIKPNGLDEILKQTVNLEYGDEDFQSVAHLYPGSKISGVRSDHVVDTLAVREIAFSVRRNGTSPIFVIASTIHAHFIKIQTHNNTLEMIDSIINATDVKSDIDFNYTIQAGHPLIDLSPQLSTNNPGKHAFLEAIQNKIDFNNKTQQEKDAIRASIFDDFDVAELDHQIESDSRKMESLLGLQLGIFRMDKEGRKEIGNEYT